MLQSLMVNFMGNNISDETDTALAAAVKQNAVLQFLMLDFRKTNISNETGTALAVAVKQNAVLQSLTVENTFLNAAPRVLRNPWSVVQSTGPVRGVWNPRRA